MKLGEFRTHLKQFDNKFDVKLSIYENVKDGIYDLEIDIVNEKCIYLRLIECDN